MSLATLGLFLLGSRSAIHAVATSRGALGVAALFVLSAGFAREYDGEDLLREPWYLLVPFAASLVTSFVLFLVLYGVGRRRGIGRVGVLQGFVPFWTAYWMTAPLAWLYAVPVERFLSPFDAMKANLALLAIVALWRVALITRVAAVLFHTRMIETIWPVMLFADTVALLILQFTPLPIIDIMGGVRLAEREALLLEIAFAVAMIGGFSWPVWAAMTLVLLFAEPPQRWDYRPIQQTREPSVGRPLRLFALASVLAWGLILPFTQPAQYHRRSVERALTDGRHQEALQYLARREPADFPPHWEPPPHYGYPRPNPPLSEILAALVESTDVPPWVRELFLGKLDHAEGAFDEELWNQENRLAYWPTDPFLTLVDQLPEGPDLARRYPRLFHYHLEIATHRGEIDDARLASLAEHVGVSLSELLAAIEDMRALRDQNEGVGDWLPRQKPER